MTASHASYQTDPRVDDSIDALPNWQQAICRRLRDLIHAADRELIETIKRTVQPYFVLGSRCLGSLHMSAATNGHKQG